MTLTKPTTTETKFSTIPTKHASVNNPLTPEKPDLKKEKIDPYTISSLSTLTSFYTSDRLKNRDTELNQSYPRILPQWIKHDKNVTFRV
jgi:hypothetical protein